MAVAVKWGGSRLAARVTGEAWVDAAVIGIVMNTRGMTELVILTVGRDQGVIDPTVFTVMVLMALITTAMATTLLALVDRRQRAPEATPVAETAAATL